MSSVALNSDNLVSPARTGLLEYYNTSLFFTPQGSQRGVIPAKQFYYLNNPWVGNGAINTAQSVFGLGSGVTVSSGTLYAFDALYYFTKTLGTNSHTLAVTFGGSASINNILWNAVVGYSTVANNVAAFTTTSTATSNAVTGAITTAGYSVQMSIKGIVNINTGGFFNPQYTLSNGLGFSNNYTTQTGSHFLIYPVSPTSGTNISLGAWA